MKTNKIRSIFYLLLLALALLLPTPLSAQETEAYEVEKESSEGIDVGKMIFGHIKDSYEWHLFDIGETKVAVHLPLILYSQVRHEWFCFSHARLEEAEEEHTTYEGFRMAEPGEWREGKVVEYNPLTGVWERPIDLSLTKNAVGIWLNVLLILYVILYCSKWYKGKRPEDGAPKGFVGLIEMLVQMVYNDLIKANIPRNVEKYANYLLCAFFFILFNNFIGLIPGSANITGNIAVTCCLALITFIMTNFVGITHKGEYWAEILWNPGLPVALRPLMLVIELFGIFTKPIALMVRLFANIMGGHTAILALIGVIFIIGSMSAALGYAVASPLAILFAIFLNCLECLVAFVQAYVFTILSSIFIGLAEVNHHSHHE